MVDPALCPIPPGFEVMGNFSNEFEHFKETTGYDDGGWGGHNYGFSNRWKNSNIRSANIVCGFQFKIGPDPGWRWRRQPELSENKILGVVESGDVTLFFPRQHSINNNADFFFRDRGNYLVALKWYNSIATEAYLNKEYPHGSYGGMNHFPSEPHWFRSQPNPRPHLEQIRDGQWHSFLGVIYNDWYRRKTYVTSGFFPTIGLWFSPIPTHNFNDFIFLGMGIDMENMKPDPVLTYGVEDSGKLLGDHILAEHPLQIRIDDVPTNQVEIRNVYAANVRYFGARVPYNPALCNSEAKAVRDAKARIVNLKKQEAEARRNYVDGGFGDESDPWRQIMDNIINIELPNANADLSTAIFNYGKCTKGLDVNVVVGKF
jgi:hypothetical protein